MDSGSDSEKDKLISDINELLENKYPVLKEKGLFTGDTVERLVNQTMKIVDHKNDPFPPKDNVEGKFSTLTYQEILTELLKYDFENSVAGGVTNEVIAASELELGYQFPESFREYLRVFGALENGAHQYAGYFGENTTEELMSITHYCQKWYGLPDGYLCLESDCDFRHTTCIDFTAGGGDDAPILWYLYDKQEFDGVHSINFDIYFRNEMKYLIQAEENFAKGS